MPNKLLVTGIEILKLINYQVVYMRQVRSLNLPEPDGFHAFVNDFAREHAAIQIASGRMERIEALHFGWCDCRLVHKLRIKRLPCSVMGEANFSSATRCTTDSICYVDVGEMFSFPVVDDDGI